MPRSATADVADLSDPVLKDRVAELKATRDQARVDAVRAQEAMDRAGPTISAGSENVCQDRPQAHANRERRLSPRPSPRARPTCRGRSERSAHHGVEKRAPAHACRSLKRKTAGFGVLSSVAKVARPTRFERVTFAFGGLTHEHYAASFGMGLSNNRKNRVLRVPRNQVDKNPANC